MKKVIFVLTLLVCACEMQAQSFYDISTLQKIEVFFSQTDWDYQLDTLKAGSDAYLQADSVRVNGQMFPTVGVKYKGNSSYNASYAKNPLHISLNEFVNQSYNGIKSIKLGNGYSDPSMIREVLSYEILKNYMDCPQANFAQVYVNGNYIGLYSNVESIDKSFCDTHFFSNTNTLVKCNPLLNPSPTTKSNLKYLTADSTSYFNYYEIKSNYGWNDLVALCDSVSNNTASAAHVLDVDKFIWMLAFDNVLVNLDSYMGVFSQNYYLYKDNTGHVNPVIWDLNMSLGGFPYLGSSNSSMAQLSVTNMQQLPTNVHANDVYWPIIKLIQNTPLYKRMYAAHVRTITNEFFASSEYVNLATSLQATIDTAVTSDLNKFYTYDNFLNSLTQEVNVGSYNVPGISNLMDARNTFLQSTTEFTSVAPDISNVSISFQPMLNEYFYITCTVTNANTVYLGTRGALTEKFVRQVMYDDGLHGDGAAADGVYGVSLAMSSAMLQYYVYADNSSAGSFSPARAEYEFYTLNVNTSGLHAGQIAINELVATNQTGDVNESGQYADWIELYNNMPYEINLHGMYISDDPLNLQKHVINGDLVLPAHTWTVLWADQNISVSAAHLNFQLNAGGEQIILSNSTGEIIDQVTFGAQTTDVAYARCPDGTGDFQFLTPTFGYNNCPISVEELEASGIGLAYPNPTSNQLVVPIFSGQVQRAVLYNELGAVVVVPVSNLGNSLEVDLSNVSAGIYSLRIETSYGSGVQRIVKN